MSIDRPAHGLLMGHPTMNANVRAAAQAFLNAGLLAEFHTAIDATAWLRLAPSAGLRTALARRAVPLELHRRTHAHPLSELDRLLRERFLPGTLRGIAPIDGPAQAIDRALARRIRCGTGAVYAYEDSARISFARATVLGVPRVYELPTIHWRLAERILHEEAERSPAWAGTVPLFSFRNVEERHANKDRELQQATRIVAASSFTRKSLEDFPGDLPPIIVVPYGAPTPIRSLPKAPARGKPLRVLYVGGLTQSKGLEYLIGAADQLGTAVTLTLVGGKRGESKARDAALARHQWVGSMTHAEVLQTMSEQDVLVAPSLFEGFGLVLTEAMSQGLPVIATTNTAGPDLITNGQEGWVVPIRSSSAIAERLLQLHDNRELLEAMRSAALARAEQLSGDRYSVALVKLVSQLMTPG